MRKNTKLFTSLAMTIALGASLAACSPSPEENTATPAENTTVPAENTAAACDSYEAFVGAVAEVKASLNSASSIGVIQAARDKVKAAYTDLEESLEKVGDDRKDAFEEAWKDLDKAVSDVDEDMTVPQAKESLSDNIAQVETAQKNLNDELAC